MSYKSEEIVAGLKGARIAHGLSQRALAVRSGLTQAHISQIERGTTEPGLSSLIDLARALDFEVTLVPKKLVPAVRAIVGAPQQAIAGPQDQVELVGSIERIVRREVQANGSSAAADGLLDSLHLLKRVAVSSEELAEIESYYKFLKKAEESKALGPALRDVLPALRRITNRIAHAREPDPSAV